MITFISKDGAVNIQYETHNVFLPDLTEDVRQFFLAVGFHPDSVSECLPREDAAPDQHLLDVAEAAEDFINSDGDYFHWTEDERHCMSRLREAILKWRGH